MSARKEMLEVRLPDENATERRTPLLDEVSDPTEDAAKLAARLAKLPAHLREAARRSWDIREEDYRFLAER